MMNQNNQNTTGYPYGYIPQQQPQQQQQHFKVYVFENTSDSASSSSQLDIQKASSIHRLVVPYFTSLSDFIKFLAERKIVEENNNNEKQQMFFLDDENQWVTVSTEDDWGILWSLLRGQKVIKVSILKKLNKKEEQPQEGNERANHVPWWFRRGGCPRRRNHHGYPQQQQQQQQPSADIELEIPLSGLLENVLGSFFPTATASNNNDQNTQTESNKQEESKKKEGCCGQQSERTRQCPFANGSLSNNSNNPFNCGSFGRGGSHPFAAFMPFLQGAFGGRGACHSSNSPNSNGCNFTPEQREQLRQQFGGLINLAKDNINNIPHFGVTCDGCNQRNFVGQRYKCQDCDDFDFCGKCFEEKAQQHAEGFHSFVVVEPKGKNFVQNLLGQFEQPQQEDTTPSSNDNKETEATTSQPTVATQTEQKNQEFVVSEPSAPHSAVDVEEQPQELELDAQLYPSINNNELLTTESIPVQQPTQQQVQQEQPQLFSQQLSILRDMGFNSEELNLRLLNKYHGDIQRTVADLLSYY